MYLHFDEVALIGDRPPQQDDPVVYVRTLHGDRILTADPLDSRYATIARRYGHIYWDARDLPCVIPDDWNDDDALLAKSTIPPPPGYSPNPWAHTGWTADDNPLTQDDPTFVAWVEGILTERKATR